jgi:hypothetical protein
VPRIRLVGIAILVLLCAPGVARAERHPTPRERTGIERAARQAYADQYFKVRVSRIEVSTVERRWATAVVATFHRNVPQRPPQRRQEWFYRTRRGWVAWFSTAMPNVDMPIEVERDLGFAGPAPLLGIPERTLAFIVLGVLALVVLVVARARLGGGGAGGGGSEPTSTLAGGGGGSQASQPQRHRTAEPVKRECEICFGRGMVEPPVCLACGGSGRIRNPNNDPGVPFINCYAGEAAHRPHQCWACHGTGEV